MRTDITRYVAQSCTATRRQAQVASLSLE